VSLEQVVVTPEWGHEATSPMAAFQQLLQADGAEVTDMPSLIAVLPCGKGERDKDARRLLFSAFDLRGHGVLEVQDILTGLTTLLTAMRSSAAELAQPPTPSVALAFETVTNQKKRGHKGVSRSEFRLLLTYLKWYMVTPLLSGSRGALPPAGFR